ncbi:hypothetical protein MWN34_08345 [Ancylobacter sp. 6x-1]|uniref:DUF2244 domain-containing protein n=1 Tax=Ancylobacter crimeensis TaxID=2579147 RepID=A0ABT0DAD7_9HYPH|nr:hypothetical protein [Ancylobacter crimeensis]MCK0196921.1 hypothetical protein [Ancylobacter crimeensis]
MAKKETRPKRRVVVRNLEGPRSWAVSLLWLLVLGGLMVALVTGHGPAGLVPDLLVGLALGLLLIMGIWMTRDALRRPYASLALVGDEAELVQIGLFGIRRRRFSREALQPWLNRAPDADGGTVYRVFVRLPDGSAVPLGHHADRARADAAFARLREALGR